MCEPASKFQQWREWLCGEDVNSIQQQIHRMIWDGAVFNLVRKARELAPKDDEENVQWNPAVSEFLLNAYFHTQSAAVRQLLDHRHDVVSLARLIDDMKKNRCMLTRKNILDAAKCPYDYETVLARLHEGGISNSDWAAADLSKTLHARIDDMTGTLKSERKPDNTVRPEVLDMLKRRTDKSEQTHNEICTYVNKFFAHAATPDSRQGKKADDIKLTLGKISKADDIKLTLGKISEAHKSLCETAAFVGRNILGEQFDQFVVQRTYDVFEHLTTPLATEEGVLSLQQEWDRYKESTEEWVNWNWQAELSTCSE